MKVSIIVPIYNVSKYIKRCLDSLINQTLEDIEIILVNDGSEEDEEKIIKPYLDKYKNIKYYKKENGGQASARNFGLEKSRGEYILFVDSDDYIETNMTSLMYKTAKDKKVDIVVCNYYMENKDNKEEINVLEENKYISNSLYVTLTPAPWNKLFKREFLINNNFSFIEGIIYEDYATIPTLAIYNPKVYFIKDYLYHYIQSENSTMRNNEYKEKYENIIPATKYLYDNMHNKGFNLELEYLIAFHTLYLASLNFYEYKKYDKLDLVSNLVKELIPKYYKNKLVKENISLSKRIYMFLFYHKKYYLINLYRKIVKR